MCWCGSSSAGVSVVSFGSSVGRLAADERDVSMTTADDDATELRKLSGGSVRSSTRRSSNASKI